MKTQLKKSLSLFLAVLMLLSCWVWVAPEKAEAAVGISAPANVNTDGNYTVTFGYNISDNANTKMDKAHFRMRVAYISNNGTSSSTQMTTYKDATQDVYTTGNKTCDIKVPGFPVYFECQLTVDENDWWSIDYDECTVVWNFCKISNGNGIEGVDIVTDQYTFTKGGVANRGSGDEKAFGLGGSTFGEGGAKTVAGTSENHTWPVISGFTTGNASTDPLTININKYDPAEENDPGVSGSVTLTPTTFYDQYGVKWIASTKKYSSNITKKTYISMTAAGADEFGTADGSDYISCSSVNTNTNSTVTVTALDALQANKEESDGIYDAHIVHSWTGTSANGGSLDSRISVPLKINYPPYNITFNGGGSVSDLEYTLNLSNGSTTNETKTYTQYYNSTLNPYPTGIANADGYTFKGLWTVAQPSEGDAHYNSFEADFATPVSATEFKTYQDNGATVSGNVASFPDGRKYYNAGEKWDSESLTVTADATYYGWWISKDIPVKFYDIDGKYLGVRTFKYGTVPAADKYPDSDKEETGYTSGAFEYSGFTGKWRDITGTVVEEGKYKFGPDGLKSLTLTPIFDNKIYTDKYTVTFNNAKGEPIFIDNNLDGVADKYDYRHILNNKVNTQIPEVAVPNVLGEDLAYSYEFSGWTTQKPVGEDKYHIVASDDTGFAENTDWVVRNDITYYPVFRSTVNEYLIQFEYKNSSGEDVVQQAVVPYGEAITTPDYVNRTYASVGMGYTLEGWDYTFNKETKMMDVNGMLIFNKENISISFSALVGSINETPIRIIANYTEGVPTPYNITFKYKNANGVENIIPAEVRHGEKITQETIDNLIGIPGEYDDGTAKYTFANVWKVKDGTDTGGLLTYTATQLLDFSPTSHVTFEAVYGEGIPFYMVTYHNGANTYKERVLAGLNVPAWMVNGEIYEPADQVAETGTYMFAGWFDEEQTDETYSATNGNKVTLDDKVNGNLDIYAQYIFEPFKYDIKFMGYDGKTVLAEASVEAGQSFKAAYDEALTKTDRDPSSTYSYTFIGWDKGLPDNFLCEGRDVTYIAQYQANYIYYKARWYKDKESMENAEPPEMEMVGEKGLLAITNHIFGGVIYAPSVDNMEIPEGKAFDGWYYIDAAGEEVAFARGLTITEGMTLNFFAKQKDADKTFTVTTVVGEKETEYQVAENGTAEAIGTPVDGYVDETNHNEFKGWFTDAACTAEFDVTAPVTADIKVYANFVLKPHVKDIKELVTAPTYYTKGSQNVWCACSKETLETVEIPELTDDVAPTGTIYLGALGSWSSNGAPAYDTDNAPISLYANDDTNVIITTNDTGKVDPLYNPAGIGIGIERIMAFVFPADTVLTAENYGAAQTLAYPVYEDNTQAPTNTANYTVTLDDLVVADLAENGDVQYEKDGVTVKSKDLEDGKSYIVYYYVIDKAGNMLNRKVRTAKFMYDTTAPAIPTITGFSNDGAEGVTIPTYCGKAVIKNVEENAKLTVNDQEVTLENGSYTINTAGNYIITVTDRAGNSTSKKIIVTAGHTEATTEKAVTCTENGYKRVSCAICKEILENETFTSEGHKYVDTVVAPTCTEAGYTLSVCTVCDNEVEVAGNPATGHSHDKDAQDNIIYTEETRATCKTKGKEVSYCTVCGKDKLEREIDIDTVNGHSFGNVKTLKATCTKDGEKYQQCKICYDTKTIETIEKLNHEGTGTYTRVTKEATCFAEGEETIYCKACDDELSTVAIETLAHTLRLVQYPNDKTPEFPNGYMQYECQVNGCDHIEGKTAIKVTAEYTVTFKAEDGTVLETIKLKDGESVALGAVAEQTKKEDNLYTYTFAGWKAASNNKVYNLPIKVTKNETYTAHFTKTDRIYTHIFEVPVEYGSNETKEYKVIVGKYGDENKKPEAIPTLDATDTHKYEFVKWVNLAATVAEGETATDEFTMTGDTTFLAQFRAIPIKYSVLYLNGTVILQKTEVNGNDSVPEFVGKNPTKAFDSQYHYEFEKWSVGENVAVTSDLYIQPVFTKRAHTYGATGTVIKAPTCSATGTIQYACSCGKTITDSIDATGEHNMVDGVCKDCNFAESVQTVTIIFKDEKGAIYTETVIPGATVEAPKTPVKDSTAEFSYKFEGWKKDGKGDLITANEFIVDSDVTYVAVFKEVRRAYTVTYYNEGNVVAKFKDVNYGANISAYNATPSKAYNSQYHYEFRGWSVNNGPTVALDKVMEMTVSGDTNVYAKYATTAHTFGDPVPGTCSAPAHETCEVCGFTYNLPGATTNAHTPKADTISIVESTFDVHGTKTFFCTSCEQTVVEELPLKECLYINIEVYNDNGDLAELANVKIKYDGEIYELYKNGKDTVKGFVSFKVDKGLDKNLWTAVIVSPGDIAGGAGGAVKTAKSETGYLNVFNKPESTDDGTQTPDTPQPEEPDESEKHDCSCTCHKNTFWGFIFRLFQKIVKFFGGKDCCADPRR